MGEGLRGAWVAALIGTLLAGCGDDGARRFSGAGSTAAGGGGQLSYAIAAEPGDLDPLGADTVSARIVASQAFEPLVATLDGPYAAVGERRGLALDWEPSGDYRVWSFRLRSGVRFQDGAPLNSAAIVANATRWRTNPVGRRLLPGLVAADAPRPNLVRLILAVPDRALPARLADPRLGIVSPPALSEESGIGATLAREQRAGSGPFQLGGYGEEAITLARYRHWWGSALGLGPALDGISFEVIEGAAERITALEQGAVRVAAGLPRGLALPLLRDPLLTVVGAGSGRAVAFERSVRGISDPRPAPLSGVWVALLSAAG